MFLFQPRLAFKIIFVLQFKKLNLTVKAEHDLIVLADVSHFLGYESRDCMSYRM